MLTVLVLIKEYTEEDEQEEDEQVEEEVCDDDESFVTAMGRLWDTGIGFFSFLSAFLHRRGSICNRAWFPGKTLNIYLSVNRPDMTFAVDWALKTNYLSVYLSVPQAVIASCFQGLTAGSICESP